MFGFKQPFGRRRAVPDTLAGERSPPLDLVSGPPRSGPMSAEELRTVSLEQLLAQIGTGDTFAMCALGALYLFGREDISRDDGLGAKWLLKSEAAGNKFASRLLANLFDTGQGVPQDYRESIKRLRPLVSAGDITAAVSLGRHYVDGRGVGRNVTLAYALFRIATRAGNADGITNLGQLAYLLLPDQINEGEALAYEWHPGRALTEFTNTSGEFPERTAENALAVYGPLQRMARSISPGNRSVLKATFVAPGNILVTVRGSPLFFFYQQIGLLGWVIAKPLPPEIAAAQPDSVMVETTAAGCEGVPKVLGALQA